MNYWTEEEVKILLANYVKVSPEELTRLLPGRTFKSCVEKYRSLKVEKIEKSAARLNGWTKEELTILFHKYNKMSLVELMTYLPERTEESVRQIAFKTGLTKKLTRWTEEDIEILKEYYNKESIECLVQRFPGRTSKSIKEKAYALNLHINL